MSARVQQILDHIEQVQYQRLSDAAVEATKTFVLDSLGVGISGSRDPFVAPFTDMALNNWGMDVQARAWVSGEIMPASSAAMINAYQIHNQEFDCVHEAAVVHPMAVILAALTAYAERMGNSGKPVSGEQFISAINVAVDIATVLGMSASQPMRFFRPGMCGGLGAAAGICQLAGFDRNTSLNALGIMYSQLGGTMQAHVEGSATLPMQIAFNARNAIVAADLAAAGLNGPQDFLDGPFGFFALMEDSGNADRAFSLLGNEWQITQVSHKPFPTGRAGHGGLDGILSLQKEHQFAATDIESIRIAAPPLVLRLVNRPVKESMNANYAKLCMGYIAATGLLTGGVAVNDFDSDFLKDSERLTLAKKVSMAPNDISDPNALAPQSVEIDLTSGDRLKIDLPAVFGHPQRPLSREQHLHKFRLCCASARPPINDHQVQKMIDQVDQLPALADVRELVSATCSQ